MEELGHVIGFPRLGPSTGRQLDAPVCPYEDIGGTPLNEEHPAADSGTGDEEPVPTGVGSRDACLPHLSHETQDQVADMFARAVTEGVYASARNRVDHPPLGSLPSEDHGSTWHLWASALAHLSHDVGRGRRKCSDDLCEIVMRAEAAMVSVGESPDRKRAATSKGGGRNMLVLRRNGIQPERPRRVCRRGDRNDFIIRQKDFHRCSHLCCSLHVARFVSAAGHQNARFTAVLPNVSPAEFKATTAEPQGSRAISSTTIFTPEVLKSASSAASVTSCNWSIATPVR